MGLLPDVAATFQVSTPQAGYVISAYALGVVVGAPLIAIAGAKASRRSLLLILMSVFTVGNLASALAPDFLTFTVLRFLTGLPHGAYFGVSALVAASLVPVQMRAQAVGYVMMGLTVATLLGTPVMAFFGQSLELARVVSVGGCDRRADRHTHLALPAAGQAHRGRGCRCVSWWRSPIPVVLADPHPGGNRLRRHVLHLFVHRRDRYSRWHTCPRA